MDRIHLRLASEFIEWLEQAPAMNLVNSLALDAFIFVVILFTMPPRTYSWRRILLVGLFGTLLWQGAQSVFGYYVGWATENFSFTDSAAAAPLFMLWIYFAAVVLLYSVELLAVMERNHKVRVAGERLILGIPATFADGD